jgi:hypothetical protein
VLRASGARETLKRKRPRFGAASFRGNERQRAINTGNMFISGQTSDCRPTEQYAPLLATADELIEYIALSTAAPNVCFWLRVQLVTATLLVVYPQGFGSPRSFAGVD